MNNFTAHNPFGVDINWGYISERNFDGSTKVDHFPMIINQFPSISFNGNTIRSNEFHLIISI